MLNTNTDLIFIKQAWSDFVDYPFVKFWCQRCDQKVFGFPEILPSASEETFQCPFCHTNWNQLVPVFHGEFEVIYPNNPIKSQTSQQITGVSINVVMGMTVSEYLSIGERIGYDTLGKLTKNYFKNTELILISNSQNDLPIYLQLPPGNVLTFSRWLQLQPIYEEYNIHEVFNQSFEDDGFVGKE